MTGPRWRCWLAVALATATLGLAAVLPAAVAGPAGAQTDGEQSPAQASTTVAGDTTTTEASGSTSTSSPPAETTTTEATTTTAEPTTTTEEIVEEEPVIEEPVEEEEVPEEEVVEETTTSTTRPPPSTTTEATRGPQSSVVAPTTTQAETTSGSSREQRVVWLVVGLLCVVGLLIGTLTWRYWWFTNPRRGYARSRAILTQSQRQLRDDADSEVVAVWEDGQAVAPPEVPVPGSPVVRDPDTLPTGMRAVRPPGERELGDRDADR